MSTLFISDLHLDPTNPALIQLAVHFLNTKATQCDSLYILGDLFNIWLGDDLIPEEFTPVIEQLQHLNHHGVKTYLMVGNRDFLMGKKFAKLTKCKLLKDSCTMDLYGTQTLLLHGDTLCTDDISYQRYRLWSRNKVVQWFFKHLPLKFRHKIAGKIKQKSKQQKQTKSIDIMDVNADEVALIMTKYGVTQLIHGHTHRPAIHHFEISGKPATRIVLGDWHSKASYLECSDRQQRLIDPRISN
jgi:UDP-2,3-diacylglucosamine hydrolase